MNRPVLLPSEVFPVRLAFDPDERLSDEAYYAFCIANRDLRCERTAQGEIIIVPPAGAESSFQSGEAFGQLRTWAKRDGRGRAFDSSVEFILATGAALSPDAAWVSKERLSKLTPDQRRRFPPVCPEFVVEVMSPSDRLPTAKSKMEEWVQAGVELGWLIQPAKQTVYVYRSGATGYAKHAGISKLAGEGPVSGFDLDLTEIWAGL